MNAPWDQITDDQIDLELAFSDQHCFNDRCGDPFAPLIECTRARGHVERETAAGITPTHATGWKHNHSRIRWTA